MTLLLVDDGEDAGDGFAEVMTTQKARSVIARTTGKRADKVKIGHTSW